MHTIFSRWIPSLNIKFCRAKRLNPVSGFVVLPLPQQLLSVICRYIYNVDPVFFNRIRSKRPNPAPQLYITHTICIDVIFKREPTRYRSRNRLDSPQGNWGTRFQSQISIFLIARTFMLLYSNLIQFHQPPAFGLISVRLLTTCFPKYA